VTAEIIPPPKSVIDEGVSLRKRYPNPNEDKTPTKESKLKTIVGTLGMA
jgi:hypothetical protein